MKHVYSDFKNTKMPFGKFKGHKLCEIPTPYIKWGIMNIQDRGIATMLSVELQRRDPKWRRTK